jgi:hypothetical protein
MINGMVGKQKDVCPPYLAGHHATLHYTWDWLEFGYWYDFWYAYQ